MAGSEAGARPVTHAGVERDAEHGDIGAGDLVDPREPGERGRSGVSGDPGRIDRSYRGGGLAHREAPSRQLDWGSGSRGGGLVGGRCDVVPLGGDPTIPFGPDRLGGRLAQQAACDVRHQAADKAGEDRGVGVDVANDDHGAQGEHGAGEDAGQGADDGASLPQHAAEDGDQKAADQDVVGDGQRGHHVTKDAGDGDHDGTEAEDVPAAVLDLVGLVLRGIGRVGGIRHVAVLDRAYDVLLGHSGGGDQGAAGGGHDRGQRGGDDETGQAGGEHVLHDRGVCVVAIG